MDAEMAESWHKPNRNGVTARTRLRLWHAWNAIPFSHLEISLRNERFSASRSFNASGRMSRQDLISRLRESSSKPTLSAFSIDMNMMEMVDFCVTPG